jgi:hypothetical protein
MTDTTEQLVKAVENEVFSHLTEQEMKTFDVRKAVSQDDVEVFLGGRLYSYKKDHLEKIVETGGLAENVRVQLLPRLRGKTFPWSHQSHTYTIENVQDEIYEALHSVLKGALSEDDHDIAIKYLEKAIAENMPDKTGGEDERIAKKRFRNGLLIRKLVELFKRKYGHA